VHVSKTLKTLGRSSERHIEAKIRASRQEPVNQAVDSRASPSSLDAAAKVHAALRRLGFRPSEASVAVAHALGAAPGLDVEPLLRACLLLLPVAS
jgi:Holliday junction resolvasome RuvABC DNA-binding subunit